MAFYEFRQNNSGGSFEFSEARGISAWVIVEADSASEANAKAEDIGLYFGGSGDCPCCGDRWYEVSACDRADVPTIYGKPAILTKFGEYPLSWKWQYPGDPEMFIHYSDGRIVGFAHYEQR